MSVQECVEEYSKLGKDVFGIQRGFPHEAMFDEKRLEDAVKRVVVAKLGKDQENAPLLDPLGKDDCCKTYASSASQHPPLLLDCFLFSHHNAWSLLLVVSSPPIVSCQFGGSVHTAFLIYKNIYSRCSDR